jgi:4'-phosphopantetheinyl transferase EntD
MAEAAAVRAAPARRRNEFVTGRVYARRAMHDLAGVPLALPMNADRTPAWPPGITGSITHSRDHCAVAVARQRDLLAIGIDVEEVGAVDRGLATELCTREELRANLEPLEPAARLGAAAVIFSAKEAFFKCQFTLTRAWLEFRDVRMRLDHAAGAFTISLRSACGPLGAAGPFRGSYAIRPGLVATAICIPGRLQCRPDVIATETIESTGERALG